MTFEEIKHKYGFHDAIIHELQINYAAGSAVLHMEFDFGDPNGPKREDYRRAVLRVSGLYFCAIEPPIPEREYLPDGCPLKVDGCPATTDTFPALEGLSRTLPPGIPCFQFYVVEWNSFINIAAKDVQISWVDEGTQAAK